jgi:Rft protein
MTASRDTVRAAARGVSAHVAWQFSSRLLAFAVKAAAVRAIGPAHFAFAELRLGILTAAALPAGLGVRKIAIRSQSDNTAAALVAAGPVALAALAAAIVGMAERGRVFAARRERYAGAARALAIARIVGSVATTAAAVLFLPTRLVGMYATPLGLVAHAITLLVAVEYAAGGDLPALPLSPASVLQRLGTNDVRMAAIAVWQAVFKFVLENGEGIIVDLTCVDPIKGAYKLAANIASLLARFFSEALEEQSFNVFSRLAPAFRRVPESDDARYSDGKRNGVLDNSVESRDMRSECITFLAMALKAALLVSLLIAVVGPSFSYPFLRLLYGSKWADETPAASILSTYFIYLVFMAGNGVTEALVSATASARKLQEQSAFSIVLSCSYMTALYFAGNAYSATGIVAVNCANMAVRTLYSLVYFTQLSDKPWRHLVLTATPHVGVLLVLTASRFMCRASERAVFAVNMANPSVVSFGSVAARTVKHAVSGAVSVLLFSIAVYAFEKPLRAYAVGLRRGGTRRHSE